MSSTKDAVQRFNGSVKKFTTEIIDFVVNDHGGKGSFQVVPADLDLEPAAGTSDAGDTDFLAAVMGNLLGDSLTKTNNIMAGVIGKYSVTGVRASIMPVAGVLGGIGDTVTNADGAIVGYIDGDTGITKANAAFKAVSLNSVPGSGFNFGLDLFGAAIGGFSELVILKSDIRLSKEVCIFQGAGAPVDGIAGTGAGFAGPGSLFIDRTNANMFINANTKASPTWKLFTRAA